MTVTDLEREAIKTGLAEGSILLVDVREPHEFAAGHIPGSVNVPLSTFHVAQLPEAGGRRIVMSCAAGVRSVRALEMAREQGLSLSEHYRGGFKDWLSSGEPIDHDM